MELPTGQEIREARNSLGLTQAEVARRAGVSQPLIARIEGGEIDITLDTLHSIVAALNRSGKVIEQEEIQSIVPETLRAARKSKGYTQSELAGKADISQALISRIERKEVNPRVSTLRVLFEQLDSIPGESTESDRITVEGRESHVLESLQSEFAELEDKAAKDPQSEATQGESSNDICGNCGREISGFEDLNFCPGCGTKV